MIFFVGDVEEIADAESLVVNAVDGFARFGFGAHRAGANDELLCVFGHFLNISVKKFIFRGYGYNLTSLLYEE